MITLQFRCTLLSDVILNEKAATESPNSSLDYIPGSCFLGIVARRYDEFVQKGWAHTLFHEGRVQFGDAHPGVQKEEGKWLRGLRTPAAFFYPKLSSLKEKCYVHHAIPNLQDDVVRRLQLKQARGDFYAFHAGEAIKLTTTKQFSIKSAYDHEKRRAKDEQLFGYEALAEGLHLLFSVRIDDAAPQVDALKEAVKKALVGTHHIGRSRSAQYGCVRIELCDFNEDVASAPSALEGVAIYAESRLCFFDEFGMPTLRPTAEQLGFSADSEVVWERSQIRTFQYAPWNGKRNSFDADRVGIEKGSLIVVRMNGGLPTPCAVGAFRSEGFGSVRYNPDFLQADETGLSVLKFVAQPKEKAAPPASVPCDTPLLNYLRHKQKEDALNVEIYQRVNEWVKNNVKLFNKKKDKKTFASQWGTIRSLAMQYTNSKELCEKLLPLDVDLRKHITLEEAKTKYADVYLLHGVAAKDWQDNERSLCLQEFMKDICNYEKRCGASLLSLALINLASEMGKECKKN